MSEGRGRQQGGGGGLPAAPQRIPGLPENADQFELSEFRTLNQQVSRAAIHDQDMAWCHNLAPIAPNYLRATPDNDAAVYDATISYPGASIIWFDFWVDKDDSIFCIFFFDDGSAQQVPIKPAGGPILTVGGPGTFSDLIGTPPAMIQAGLAGAVVVLIVSTQAGAVDTANGYFIWDGTNLFKAGTVSPVATITDGGNGYSSPPGVTIYGGSGSGATAIAKVDLGAVSEITVTSPGSGYLATDTAILLFDDGVRVSAVGVGNTSDGVITSMTLVSGGSGFTSVPTIVFTPIGAGSGAHGIVTSISGGIITGLQMLDGGSGYSSGVTVSTSGGGGGGAIIEAVIEDGVVTSVTMVHVGFGYTKPPDVVYHSTSGSGASGVAVIQSGSVAGVRFDFPSQGGSGYETPPIVQFTGGGGIASGSIDLMPFGIVGYAIESYVGRVWIFDANRFFFSAPESLVDFGNGGGVFQDADSFLRVIYKRGKQSNGFLYILGDSSVNYIAGVTTNAASSTDATPITTFTNLNIDPQIGTSWVPSVTFYSRQIMFANQNGVFAITGGAIQKVSPQLDRLFYDNVPDIPSILANYPPSSAVTRLFATDTFMFLTGVFNPFTRAAQPILLMWNGKRWWTADQTADILLINNYEADSVNQAYGTDGKRLYKILATPSSLLERVLQSKLWLHPSIIIEKKAWAIYALFECYDDTVLDFTIDSETGVFSVTQGAFAGTGSLNVPGITWARSSAPAPAGMTIGFTMTSTSANFSLLTTLLLAQAYASRT